MSGFDGLSAAFEADSSIAEGVRASALRFCTAKRTANLWRRFGRQFGPQDQVQGEGRRCRALLTLDQIRYAPINS